MSEALLLPVCRYREVVSAELMICRSPRMAGDASGRQPCSVRYCVACALADLPARVDEPAMPASTPYRPCRHEGPVVEWAPCVCEWRHVRACLYDGPDERYGDRCTRGPNNGEAAGVASCFGCPHHEPGAAA